MNGIFLCKIFECAVVSQMVVDNILNRSGHKKILLTKTKTLALRVVIRRIKHLANDLCHCVLLHCAHIVALVKHIHVNTG